MRANTAPAVPAACCVVVVTSDELVGPEAQTHLAPDYDLHVLPTWQDLEKFLKKQWPDAILLDIDTDDERGEDGVRGLAELRSVNPNLLLVALTRSDSSALRYKAIDAAVDEYFVAPVDFAEIRVVLGRMLQKRSAEIEYRLQQEEAAAQQSLAELVGGSEPMLRLYDAIRRIADSPSTV